MQLRFAVLGLLNLYRSRADLPTFLNLTMISGQDLEAYHEWFDTKPYAREMVEISCIVAKDAKKKMISLMSRVT